MFFSIAWIGSLAYGLSMTFGPVTSMLVRRFGYSKVMMTGAAICAGSVIASSFATSIPQLFISFSVLYGIGTCMATGPTMTITAVYFDKYLTIATGITVSGSSFGTLIMGPLSQVLIDSIGWRNAFRIYSGLHIITVLMDSRIKASIPRSRNLEKKKSFLYDFRIWKNRVFVIWTGAITLVMFGFYIPYVHLVSDSICSFGSYISHIFFR
ncbi:MAG: MFS transporter [Candidatus Thiodiazotropha taylori]